jgi:phosphatidylglycerol---prolipoprotein diacylglyceryl transferase
VVFERIDLAPRHPAQLYEAAAYAVIFIGLLAAYLRRGAQTRPGSLLGAFFVTVFGFRFVVEFVKERQVAWESDLALSMGQFLSIPLVLAGVWLLWTSRRREPPPETAGGG